MSKHFSDDFSYGEKQEVEKPKGNKKEEKK